MNLAPIISPMGICSPMCPAAEVLPFGAALTASCISPYPGVLRDNTSVSSMVLGEEAAGRDPLSITFGSSEFPVDEDRRRTEWVGLQHMI